MHVETSQSYPDGSSIDYDIFAYTAQSSLIFVFKGRHSDGTTIHMKDGYHHFRRDPSEYEVPVTFMAHVLVNPSPRVLEERKERTEREDMEFLTSEHRSDELNTRSTTPFSSASDQTFSVDFLHHLLEYFYVTPDSSLRIEKSGIHMFHMDQEWLSKRGVDVNKSHLSSRLVTLRRSPKGRRKEISEDMLILLLPDNLYEEKKIVRSCLNSERDLAHFDSQDYLRRVGARLTVYGSIYSIKPVEKTLAFHFHLERDTDHFWQSERSEEYGEHAAISFLNAVAISYHELRSFPEHEQEEGNEIPFFPVEQTKQEDLQQRSTSSPSLKRKQM